MKGSSFLFRNLLKGFIWLLIIVAIFIFFKEIGNENYYKWLEPIYNNTPLIFAIYLFSELVFGLFPPELFMIWSLSFGSLQSYIFYVLLLSVISYFAGILGYFFGEFLNRSKLFVLIKRKTLGKYVKYLFNYGEFLVIVAALTPIPFSAIAMLVGSLRLPFKKYLLFSLTRFIRFAAYAYIIWEANLIS